MQKTILFIVLLLSLKLSAQTDEVRLPKNTFSVNLGYDKGYFKDVNFSPLNYVSKSVAIELGYSKVFKSNTLFFNIGFANGPLTTPVTNYFSADRYLANVKLGYLKEFGSSGAKIKFKAGAQYHSYLDMTFYDEVDAFTYFGLHGFDVVGNLNYQLNTKHNLGTTLEIPVVGILVRPPYSGINKFQQEETYFKTVTKGEWTSWNDFMALQWSIYYKFAVSQKFEVVLTNNFNYHKTEYLHKTSLINNQILIGTNFKF